MRTIAHFLCRGDAAPRHGELFVKKRVEAIGPHAHQHDGLTKTRLSLEGTTDW
jgi:hypothetical protein